MTLKVSDMSLKQYVGATPTDTALYKPDSLTLLIIIVSLVLPGRRTPLRYHRNPVLGGVVAAEAVIV